MNARETALGQIDNEDYVEWYLRQTRSGFVDGACHALMIRNIQLVPSIRMELRRRVALNTLTPMERTELIALLLEV